MVWFIVFLAVVVIGIAWIAARGRLGGMPPAVDDRPGPDLPDSELTGEDLRGARFAVTMRGYSMEQVDALLERLADQLDGKPYEVHDAYDAWLTQTDPVPEADEVPAEEDEPAEDDEPEDESVEPAQDDEPPAGDDYPIEG